MRYRPIFDEEALRTLLAVRSRRHRERLLDAVARLARDPFCKGDFTMADASGQPAEIIVAGSYLISYWADHAVRELRILDLQRA